MDSSGAVPDVTTAAQLVRDGDVSARELVEASLARVDAQQDALNAFVYVDRDGALAAADAVDRARRDGAPLGPLAGVPFGVKDLEDCAGMPTTRGSRWYAGGPPAERDDIHVERFRAAGAIPIGKTAAPEFGAFGYTASPLLGVTRNPWNLERTPGGSSGGTAASVSAGAIPFGTASDGGGSIRGPAASCGLPGTQADLRPHPHLRRHPPRPERCQLRLGDHRDRHRHALRPGRRARHARPHVGPRAGVQLPRRHRAARRERLAVGVVGGPRLRHHGPRGRSQSPPPRRGNSSPPPTSSTVASTCRSTTSSGSTRSWRPPISS